MLRKNAPQRLQGRAEPSGMAFFSPHDTEGFCSWLVVLFLKVAASEPSDGTSVRDGRPMMPAQHLPSILPLDSPPFVPAMEVVEF